MVRNARYSGLISPLADRQLPSGEFVLLIGRPGPCGGVAVESILESSGRDRTYGDDH